VPLGVNVTPTVHAALTAMAAARQVLDAIPKSVAFVPITVTPLICRGAPLLFVTAIETGAEEVPVEISGKSMGLDGAKPTIGVGPRVQVRIFCVAVIPPAPPVNPTYPVVAGVAGGPSVIGISIVQVRENTALVTVSVIVIVKDPEP
jgi:hypothetical protein